MVPSPSFSAYADQAIGSSLRTYLDLDLLRAYFKLMSPCEYVLFSIARICVRESH